MRGIMGGKHTVTGPRRSSPYDIGLCGSVNDLYEADIAAKADIPVKEAAYQKEDRKQDTLMGTLFRPLTKLFNALDALYAAEKRPYEIHAKLYNGALQAFRDGRPENLQEILAHPESFQRYSRERPEMILTDTLIVLAELFPDPLIQARALKKIAADDRPGILEQALHQAIRTQYEDPGLESKASVLLRAGARAKGAMLATAIDRGAPQAVHDLLLKYGTSYQDALREMRQNPQSYTGGGADRLELAMTKQAKAHLEDAMRTLTGEEPAQRLQGPKAGKAEVYTGRPKEIRTKPITL